MVVIVGLPPKEMAVTVIARRILPPLVGGLAPGRNDGMHGDMENLGRRRATRAQNKRGVFSHF